MQSTWGTTDELHIQLLKNAVDINFYPYNILWPDHLLVSADAVTIALCFADLERFPGIGGGGGHKPYLFNQVGMAGDVERWEFIVFDPVTPPPPPPLMAHLVSPWDARKTPSLCQG